MYLDGNAPNIQALTVKRYQTMLMSNVEIDPILEARALEILAQWEQDEIDTERMREEV